MRTVLRRTWREILAVALAQILLSSRSVDLRGGDVEAALMRAFLYMALFLMTSFVGGAVHAVLLRRRPEVSLSTCLVDGAMIGLLSNLLVQLLWIAVHGLSLNLVMPPTGDAGPVLWMPKLVLSVVIVSILGFTGLILGGMGGGLVGLVSNWVTHNTASGGRHD